MDSFQMLHGIVKCVGSTIMYIKFFYTGSYEFDAVCDAVAIKEVCYVKDSLSKNLQLDFASGQKVQFSAVRDLASIVPNVWKAVAVWTTYKPLSCFNVGDWSSTVWKLYRNHSLINIILNERLEMFQKNIAVERIAVRYLSEKIYSDLRRNELHRIDNYDLDDMLLRSDGQFSGYIETVYGAVSDFIAYHSTVFEISARGNIFILMSEKDLELYLSTTLDEKLRMENKQIKSEEVKLVVAGTAYEKIYQLEKEAISHFYFRLREIQETLGVVYCLSSKCLEELLNRAPDVIRTYLKQTYKSLTDFVLFHKAVFLIGPCCTVFPATQIRWTAYVTDGLERVVPNDAHSKKLYDLFIYRHKVITENTQTFSEKEHEDKKVISGNSLIRPRSKVVEGNGEEENASKDVASQTSVPIKKPVFTALDLLK